MRFFTIISVVAGLALFAPSAGAALDAKQVQQLLKTIDEGMFPRVAASSMRMISYKSDVVQKEIAMELMMSSDKALIGITSPATDKGKYILKSGKNLWMYFSDIKRSIRLSARDAFMGTDATNYDVLQLNLLGDYDVKEYSEGSLDGRPVLKVELAARPGTEGYHRITSWIDPQERRLIKNDCYSISGTMIKTIQYEETTKVSEFRVPASVLIVNHLDKDRTTRIEFGRVEARASIRDSVFTLGYLESLN